MSQGIHLRKYGVEATINFELYDLDGVDMNVGAASASGDINIMRDEAAEEQLDADAFVDEGTGYSLVLSAAEMTAARIIVYIIDQTGPKDWLDKAIIVETYGNASAQHSMDFDDADGSTLTEVGGDGAQLTAINLPNQTMDITGNLSGSVGSVSGAVGSVAGNVDGLVSGTVAGKTPSEAGDAMNLAADAIKAVSYDESTAFPVKADDAGGTQIARVGADSDTLETLSDEIATVKAETASIQTETTALDTLTKAAGDGDLAAVLVDTAQIGAAVGASISADVAAVKAETALIVADTNELQGDWANGGRLDLLLDAIKAVTDNQAAASGTLITGTVSWDNTNATTTVIFSDDVTEATADHYNGRLFVPTSGALVGQYTDITDYALDTGEGKFTVTALTEAPADNTTFVII